MADMVGVTEGMEVADLADGPVVVVVIAATAAMVMVSVSC